MDWLSTFKISMDEVNSIFPLLSVVFVLMNCSQLLKDKVVKGVSVYTVAFFTFYAFWNVFYFYNLGQIFSLYSGILFAIIHTYWLGMILWYSSYPKYKTLRRDSE